MRKKCLLLVVMMMLCWFTAGAQSSLKAGDLIDSDVVQHGDVKAYFSVSAIDDSTLKRMQKGGSYPKGCIVDVSELRYVRVLHYNYDGKVQVGELVCNRRIADDLMAIFRELFDARYQIERMMLIDEYGADDETSMQANNTSAFCYRKVKGSSKLSAHARGLAVDVNPLHNPCFKVGQGGSITRLQPNTKEARRYADRTKHLAHMIDKSDLCYKAFIKRGFRWGGAWKTKKDYQHFEKTITNK